MKEAGASGPPPNFTYLLNCLLKETSGETVTLGQLMHIVERRSFGAVILLLGLIAVSPLTIVPGATWTVAAATLLFSVQLLRPALESFVKASRKMAHIADSVTAPRLGFLTRPPFVIGVAVVCILASLVTFPLGLVPLAPLLPGISILLMGIGLTARDGVFLLLSTLAMVGSILLVARWLL
jgi:hypothetical protein